MPHLFYRGLVEVFLDVQCTDGHTHIVVGHACTDPPSRIRVLDAGNLLVELGPSFPELVGQQADFIAYHLPNDIVGEKSGDRFVGISVHAACIPIDHPAITDFMTDNLKISLLHRRSELVTQQRFLPRELLLKWAATSVRQLYWMIQSAFPWRSPVQVLAPPDRA